MTSLKRSEADDPGTDEYGVTGEGKVGAHLWLPPPLLSERVLALEVREAFSLSKRGNPRRVIVLFALSARECGWDTRGRGGEGVVGEGKGGGGGEARGDGVMRGRWR